MKIPVLIAWATDRSVGRASLLFTVWGFSPLLSSEKKNIFLSLTCSGLAKVAASHFRTFLYKSSKCHWGNLIFNCSLKRLKNYIFRHRLIFQLSEIIINAAPAEKTLKIIFLYYSINILINYTSNSVLLPGDHWSFEWHCENSRENDSWFQDRKKRDLAS